MDMLTIAFRYCNIKIDQSVYFERFRGGSMWFIISLLAVLSVGSVTWTIIQVIKPELFLQQKMKPI